MNRIVRENYPVMDLPEDLRGDFPDGGRVRVVIEWDLSMRDKVLTIDELFAMRRPPYRTTEDIVGEVRRIREEWDA